MSTTYRFLANTGSQMTSVDEVVVDSATESALEEVSMPLAISSGQSSMFALVRLAEATRELGAALTVNLPALRNMLQLMEVAARHHGTVVEVVK